MGRIGKPEEALLFIGALFSDSSVLDHARQTIVREFGDTILTSPVLEWNYSTYYRDELGWPILRQFMFFGNVIDPASIPDIKTATNEIEESHRADGKRRINLDPGYLTLSKIVLASTKNYSHRLYLGKGIYGEVTLYYQHGMFRPHLFTYRDYREKNCIEMFMQARELLKKQIVKTAG